MCNLQSFDDPDLDVLMTNSMVERQQQDRSSYEETDKQTGTRKKWEIVKKVGEGAVSRVYLHECIEIDGRAVEKDHETRAVKTIYVANDAPYNHIQEIKALLFFTRSKVTLLCPQKGLY